MTPHAHRSEEPSSTTGSKAVLTAEGITKHMKMESRSTEEEEEEWCDDGTQINGKSQTGIRFKKSGRVSRLTRLEKAFLVLLFLLTVALIAVIVALTIKLDKDGEDGTVTATNGNNKQESTVCLSAECVTAAAGINSKIDHSVHPCDDFYQFACGTWMKGKVIPGDKSRLTSFSELRDDVDLILKNLLETEISPTESDYTTKAKIYYASCLNYDLINKLGMQPFHDFIKSKFGGWPLTESDWKPEDFDMTNLTITLNFHQIFPLLALYVGVNRKNSSKHILQIDQVSLSLPSQKYYQVPRNDSMLMALETKIFEYGKLFGFTNSDTAEQEVKDIVDFEIKVANILVPPEDRRDSNTLWNPMTLAQIQGNYSQIVDWKRYAHGILTPPGIEVTDVTDEEIVINLSPPYYEKLIDLLNDTPKRTIANYMIWYAISSLSYTQGEEIRKINREYSKVIYGVAESPPRYRTCVEYATDNLAMAVGKLFIKDNFDAESKTFALDMIKDLHHSFDDILKDNDWMDENTKKFAEEKNRFISPKIGYPEKLTNETYMMEFYENYTFNRDQFLENSLTIERNGYKRIMKKLRDPVDKKMSSYDPTAVNAYYSPTLNQIMFPAGILQPPFFKRTYPRYLNYGGIGVVIGHEITHGFDDRGRQYDKEGNLVQWWSDQAVEKFKVKSQCIVNQYSNYTVGEIDMNLNGINTQGENIADNGGLKQSFNAYRYWVDKNGQEKSLPGLVYTQDQLFFINFAQIWCSVNRDSDAILNIRSGVHSPGRFRVIGTAQNSEDFSRVFQCPKTSKMNSKKKCSVW